MAAEVKYRIRAEDKTRAGVDSARSGLGDIEKGIGSLVAKALTIGAAIQVFRTLVNAVKDAEQAFFVQEQAVAKLNAVIRSTGGAAGMTSGALQRLATEIQRTTGYGDEMVLNAQAIMLTFTRVGRDVFPAATRAAVDMSAVLGQDLQSSVIMLGKALNDPIAGVTALRRVGVQLTEQQEAAIKVAMEQNDILTAQGVILAEVNKQMGGAAEAMGNTAAGAALKLKNAMSDLQEAQGEAIALGMRPFREWLTRVVEGLTLATNQANALSKILNEGLGGKAAGEIETLILAIAELDRRIELGGRSSANRQSVGSRNDVLSGLQAERDALAFRLNHLQESAKLEERRAATRAESDGLAIQNQEALNALLQEWAATDAGQLAALREKIKLYSSPVYDQNSQIVKDVLATLRAQLPVVEELTKNQEAMQNHARGYKDIMDSALGPLTQISDLWGDISEYAERTQRATAMTTAAVGSDAWRAQVGGVQDTGVDAQGNPLPPAPPPAPASAGGGGGMGGMAASFMAAAQSVDSLRMVMDPLGTIFQSMFQVLAPVLDEVLTPVVGALAILGQLLGMILVPVIKALTPIIELLGKIFVWLYNTILLPVGKALATIFVGVVNVITAVINAIIWVINLFLAKAKEIDPLAYSSVDTTDFQPIDYNTLLDTGSSALQGVGRTPQAGLAATYTAPRIININAGGAVISIKAEAIAGEGSFESLVRMIMSEWRRIEGLGY